MLRLISFLLLSTQVFNTSADPINELNSLTNSETTLFNKDDLTIEGRRVSITSSYKISSILELAAILIANPKNLRHIYINFMQENSNHSSIWKNSSVTLLQREQIFSKNLRSIVAFNFEARQGFHSFEKSVNFFSDMTLAEIEEFATCIDTTTTSASRANENSIPVQKAPKSIWDDWLLTVHWFWGPSLPSSKNWTAENIISPVGMQGYPRSCGSCWAWATATCVEAYFAQNDNSRPLVELSKQQLLDCSTKNYGCRGGNLEPAFAYVHKIGLSTERDYPYAARDDLGCQTKPKYGKIEGFRTVSGGEDELMREVAHNPVAVSLCPFDFTQYKSGVFDIENCCKERKHAMVVTGYGVQSGKEFWTIKNSWGIHWGERGYIRIRRNKNNMCNVAGAGVVAYHVTHGDMK